MSKSQIPTTLFSTLYPLSTNSVVIAGISGGPDSTALLVLLHQYVQKKNIRVIVAHVNHGIRGKAADRDEAFVHALAQKFNFDFESLRTNLSGSGIEEQGREVRREFFLELQKQYKADWILTAHTADDHAETILFRLLRGTGIGGLAGIGSQEGTFLRPLINTTKKELLAFLKRNKQKFCTDATNTDESYTRNFIRKKMMPLCEKINPSYRDAFSRLSKIAEGTEEWIENEAALFIGKKVTKNQIPAHDLLQLALPLQAAVINRVYKEVAKTHYHLPLEQLDRIRGMLVKNVGNKRVIYKKAQFHLRKGLLEISL
ncbi:tRNA lysidine(34) synthetase TilS [Candidatus Gracilibacteria bacterium]|nr:tRNA lysidine(34) synthetase TilS [Candidatus Gracilibacteria bacterium]